MRTKDKAGDGCCVAITAAAVGAGDALTAGPAYADVVTNGYTIGTASSAVGTVSADPTDVSAGTPTKFEVHFVATSALSEREHHHYR